MKFKLAPLLAAAVLATCGMGHAVAAPVTTAVDDVAPLAGVGVTLSGSSRASFAYSDGQAFDGLDTNKLGGGVGAWDFTNVKVRDLNGAGFDETYMADEFGDPVRIGISASFYVDGQTLDNSTGQILSVSTTGGLEHRGSRIGGTLTGGVATMTNLRFDLASQVVHADLAGTKAAVLTTPSVSYDLPNTALWTIGSVSGPSIIDPAALALTGQARIDALVGSGFSYEGGDVFGARIVVSQLRLTTEGFNFLRNSLGLLSTGLGIDSVNVDAEGWGSTTLNLRFSVAAVPEPSTYALAAVGLLVVYGARRRAPRKD